MHSYVPPKECPVGIEFSKRLGRGFFGGEGFIMQKLEGDGMAFVHAGGTLARKELAAGEVLRVDTGCIVGFTQNVDYDIEFVGGIKNTIFGGEGLFFASLRGPGNSFIFSPYLLAGLQPGYGRRLPKVVARIKAKEVFWEALVIFSMGINPSDFWV